MKGMQWAFVSKLDSQRGSGPAAHAVPQPNNLIEEDHPRGVSRSTASQTHGTPGNLKRLRAIITNLAQVRTSAQQLLPSAESMIASHMHANYSAISDPDSMHAG